MLSGNAVMRRVRPIVAWGILASACSDHPTTPYLVSHRSSHSSMFRPCK
jgi:hypothetical protein